MSEIWIEQAHSNSAQIRLIVLSFIIFWFPLSFHEGDYDERHYDGGNGHGEKNVVEAAAVQGWTENHLGASVRMVFTKCQRSVSLNDCLNAGITEPGKPLVIHS